MLDSERLGRIADGRDKIPGLVGFFRPQNKLVGAPQLNGSDIRRAKIKDREWLVFGRRPAETAIHKVNEREQPCGKGYQNPCWFPSHAQLRRRTQTSVPS